MAIDKTKSGFSDEEIAEATHNLIASIRRGGDDEIPFWHELPEDAWQKEDSFRQIELLTEFRIDGRG